MIGLPTPTLHVPRNRPRISFVVAWQGCLAELSARLKVWSCWVEEGIDVVLVCSCPLEDRRSIGQSHPGLRIVAAGSDVGLAAMRHLGVRIADGDIVVIVDDAVASSSSWRDQLPAAIRREALRDDRAPWGAYPQFAPIAEDATVR